MRSIPPALQAKLDSGVTTLCRCWVIVRRDGVTQGFTDHDDGSELSGALADETLNEDDLAAGRYDAAAVELWLVDWSEPSLRVLLAKGSLGEIKRAGTAFTAEVRGLSQRLAETSGRLYTATCSADLGDARCKVDLNAAAFRGSGVVVAVSATSSFTASGLDSFTDGWFSAGRLTFTSGANAGLSMEVKSHRNADGVTFDLWQAMPEPIAPGDTFEVRAGCDKRLATCHDRFNNVVNFRGFPHIPGNDFVIRYPLQGEPGNDGGSMNT